mgnify:CR=1 FL=1
MSAYFGPAGNAQSFTEQGFKRNDQVPEYLTQFGLNAYEYQCGHGVRVNPQTAEKLRIAAQEKNIKLSLHSPYYISLSSVEKEKRDNSVDYVLQSARAAKMIGADRVVVHSGSCGKMTREEALALAKDTVMNCLKAMDDEGLGEIAFCPETMGKINQLGNLDEVLSLCELDERLIPCIDFGHLNARTLGGVNSQESFLNILNLIENRLGADRLKRFHSHFSKIEYTANGGEKRHLTFDDTVYGPEFEPLAELIAKKNLSPVFICESAGTQAEDAQRMMLLYRKYLED